MESNDNDKVKKYNKGIQEVANEIMEAIAKGELEPGQRLVETHLMKLYGVKRNKIRMVLNKLEHDGFVKIIPHAGAIVAEFSHTDIEQIYDLLSVLDGLAVRLITPFITVEQLGNLEKLLEQMEATDNSAIIADYNDKFHKLLCIYSENDRLINFSDKLNLNITAFGYRSFHVPGQVEATIAEHRKIFQAIKENNPEKAEKLMRKHLIDAKKRLIKWLYRSL